MHNKKLSILLITERLILLLEYLRTSDKVHIVVVYFMNWKNANFFCKLLALSDTLSLMERTKC